MPQVDARGGTEGLVDHGLGTKGWGPTIGSIRQPIPTDPDDSMQWWPLMVPPDGFVGFAQPPTALPWEKYQEPAYVAVQPDPVAVDPETFSGPIYDHGVEYIADDVDSSDGNPGILTTAAKWLTDVPNPAKRPASDSDPAWGTLTQCLIQNVNDTTNNIKQDAVIVTSKIPVALVGVWSDNGNGLKPLKAKITNAALINPKWPKYNVIDIIGDKGIPADAVRIHVAYYAPGTTYVITQTNPLPMPYTVYSVPILMDGQNYVDVNSAILKFDPDRAGDVTDPALVAAKSPLLGIYQTPDLDQGPQGQNTNLWDLTAFKPGQPHATNILNSTMTRLYLSKQITLRAGDILYVKVSTNAVSSVTVNGDASGTNYYPAPNSSPGGYCSKSGIIKMGTPLPAPPLFDLDSGLVIDPSKIKDGDKEASDNATFISGQPVTVTYRTLSTNAFTIGRAASISTVNNVGPLAPAASYSTTGINIRNNGHFTVIPDLPFGTYGAQINYTGKSSRSVVWLNTSRGLVPAYWDGTGNAVSGAPFRVELSAGLNMSNPKQWPSPSSDLNNPDIDNKRIYDPSGNPMYYEPALKAYTDGTPLTHLFSGWGGVVKSDGKVTINEFKDFPVTVHDSRRKSTTSTSEIDYGGQVGDLDSLTCYPDPLGATWYPVDNDVKPLTCEPVDEENLTDPDQGSSSTQFVFRVRYHNRDNLQPMPWLHPGDDAWNSFGNKSATGVVLYLDDKGTGDYHPHFMRREFPDQPSSLGPNGTGDVYIYRIIPHHTIVWSGPTDTYFWPHQELMQGNPGYTVSDAASYDNNLYASMGCGTYHYFFACSDDSLAFWNGSYPFENQTTIIPPDNPDQVNGLTGQEEWGEIGSTWRSHSSSGLDPSAARDIYGYPEISRAPHRRYSSDNIQAFDSTIFVDRPVRAPGEYESYLLPIIGFTYKYPSDSHPVVTCELHMPYFDDLGLKTYDDTSYGLGRFFGTLFPYYSAVNPVHPGAHGNGGMASLAETAGSKSKDINIFRILYRQISNQQAPIYVRLFINDASEKSGTDTAHQYRSYTMKPRADQTVIDYTKGVWYEVSLQSGTKDLPLGPHTYYFEAYDGLHKVRWPVRPDNNLYSATGVAANDWWVPTGSQPSERNTPTYFDNDYVPGPYVNNPPQITNVTVTPGTGKEGTHFVYSATYTDPDGQRPYRATLWIEVNDNHEKRSYSMYPDPSIKLDPNADNTALFKQGVKYMLDTSSQKDLALQNGVRRFYVEFTDDWGRQDNAHDTRPGELVRYPAGDGNWVSGPVISGNNPPTLSDGSVTSPDGTSNAATAWMFKVKYTDLDNDAPQVIKVFIGELQPQDPTNPNANSKVKTVVWDDGHTLLPSDPNNSNFINGAYFYYQTRLGGPDGAQAGRQYYYAFEAYDGTDFATYKSTSNMQTRSNAAGCFVMQDADMIDSKNFILRPKVIRAISNASGLQTINPDPLNDVVRVWGVFDNEDLTGTNYYPPPSDGTAPADFVTGSAITLTKALPSNLANGIAYVLAEADTPIVGPLLVQEPAPAGTISDAEVFVDYTNNGQPSLLFDQKNGYVSPDGTDRAVLTMSGAAAYHGLPSEEYVAPINPDTIASVEGVYWLDDPDPNTRYTNYFNANDPAQPNSLVLPITRQATLNGKGDTVIMQDPEEVYKVLGVYESADLTGPNHFLGVGYPVNGSKDNYLWQEARVVSGNIIWPTDPMNIVSIKGVYASASINDPGGNLLPADPAVLYRVPGTASLDGTTATIDSPYDAQQDNASQFVVNIFSITGTDGTLYYTSPDPAGTPYKTGDTITLDTQAPSPDGQTPVALYVYYQPLETEGFGPYHEFMTLKAPVPSSLPKAGTVYIAYYPPADLDTNGQLALTSSFADPTSPAYVKIWAKGFNPGDDYIKLTTKLPLITANAVGNAGDVKVLPATPQGFAGIGIVREVTVGDDHSINYYANTKSVFKPGDTQIFLGTALPNPLPSAVKVWYVPLQRNVVVKYDDLRYTHQIEGWAGQVLSNGNNLYISNGTTHFIPNAYNPSNITGNSSPDPNDPAGLAMRDMDAGVVGVWENADLSGTNYFNPRRILPFDDDPMLLRLNTQAPSGKTLYARVYQKGEYFLDRWNRKLRFVDDVGNLQRVQASYFFGTRMPFTILQNNPPVLSEGQISSPNVPAGSRSTGFVYSVKYTDIDGPNGQMPSYVRVYIDGVPHDMTPVGQGTPTWRTGAVYTYTPSGMTGGSHTYHFEASDGMAVAWFDSNGPNSQVQSGSSTPQIIDINGPWVNDPPTLSNGAVSPNTQGGIPTTASVDYTVTLMDMDNDPPFVFDPSRDSAGANYSGSPRLWVDASSLDDSNPPITGTIVGLEPDPLKQTKMRVIVAGGSPNWTTDQFAGKLMQITNGDAGPGSPYLRVYLIQSNTDHKLVIATDTLENDGLVAAPGKDLIQFRINGLLMSKVDESQVNFTLGIPYKVTIPGLTVGTHRFHFTARTRETKPDWLLALANYTNKVPYSNVARFPTTGDLSGPTVISTTPPDNVAPVVSKVGSSTLYRGPRAKNANVTTPSTCVADYNGILTILGVYKSVTLDSQPDATVNPGLSLDLKSYLDPSVSTPPATNDPIKLSPSLTVTKDTDVLVQHAAVTSLTTIMPDSKTSVGTALGAYLTTDKTLKTIYHIASGPAADGTITLSDALPVGTSDVYLTYNPAVTTSTPKADGTPTLALPTAWNVAYVKGVYLASDTTFTNNLIDPTKFTPGDTSVTYLQGQAPATGTDLVLQLVNWPPVYVKYYMVEPATSTQTVHGVFTAGEPLTFEVFYQDANDDAPTYHNGVQGYVKVVFDDDGSSAQLLPMATPMSYITGVPFGITLTNVREGTHKYHFEASDGYVVTRFPKDPPGVPNGNDESIKINYKPVLKSGTVDHTSGANGFTFSVTYQDLDNVAPPSGAVKLILKNRNTGAIVPLDSMTTTVTSPNYSTGVKYSITVGQPTPLPAGWYDSTFTANDGTQDADPLVGPAINVRAGNQIPVIVNYEVMKLVGTGQYGSGAGKTTDTFVYRAWYHDDDNDAPVFNGITRQTALSLIIDGKASAPIAMTLVTQPSQPGQPPWTPDYTSADGVEFQARISGKTLGSGNHTYTVVASDGTDPAVFADGLDHIKNGPILMIPFFNLSAVGKDGEQITDRSTVGQEVLIQGQMYFPYTDDKQQPTSINNITIQVTKPDSTAVALNATLTNLRTDNTLSPKNWIGDITVQYSGYVDPALVTGQSLTMTASGQWTINATWPGNTLYDGAATDSITDGHNDAVYINVSGPSRTVATANPLLPATAAPVTDMITPPMIIGSTNPGGIFGADRALQMQIVKWSPSNRSYFWYDIGGIFPALQPGDAVWIKPKATNPSNPGSGYPAAEPLGNSAVQATAPSTPTIVPITWSASRINGVYLNSNKTGVNYYDPTKATVPFKSGDNQVILTTSVGSATQVYVDYVGPQNGVDEGWIALDNPAVESVTENGEPRYYHNNYRLIKVLAQAYPLLTGPSGAPVLDYDTQLPELKPCTISLSTGWNQFGNIFYNWKKTSQQGTALVNAGVTDYWSVAPVLPNQIGKLLGVYLNPQLTGVNYYQPGISTQPYKRGDTVIHLTTKLPVGTTTVYIKQEAYPRVDVGIPISELHVNYLGQRKSLTDAKAAGWILDYAWRYDAILHDYVKVSATSPGAETVLKAWSGYWIKAMVDCQLEIDPNTTYNGATVTSKSVRSSAYQKDATDELPPPAPN